MRYWIVQLEEINGEHKYEHTFTLKAGNKEKALEMLEHLAGGWYNFEPEKKDEYYMYFSGSIAITPHKVEEVTKRVYKKVKNIVNDLTHVALIALKIASVPKTESESK